jgi:uncharacterized membrane protein YdfJ with MMPL/SSD domain
MERPPREAEAGPPRTPPSPPASKRRASFLSITLADTGLIKALGLTKDLAVLVDATLVRALLVPATMRLLQRIALVLTLFGESHRLQAISFRPRDFG